ncbi:EpsG family protein [Peribacillus sp. NPDC006672]|uniref:EpsG family protein n=1 Tax=Peribacillus sp. NPDC006672 TaxID=3390606 RepID=UPI003D05A742
MVFYLSWFTLTFLLLALTRNVSRINLIIVFILLTLVYGGRNLIGVDDLTYISSFNNANSGGLVYGMERSFIVISKFLGDMGLNFRALFFFYALVSFTFMYLSYKELCQNKYEWIVAILGFIVFAFVPTITLMRQFAAAAILTYAFLFILKKKNILALIFIAFASVFHLGSVICFMFLPFFLIRIKVRTKIILPIICLAIGYFGIFNNLLNLIDSYIPNKYIGYLNSSTVPQIGLLHLILITIYILQFLLPILYKTKKQISDTTDFLERAQMLYFSVYFITLSSGWTSRMSIYFILFVPFIFKTFITRFKLEKDKQMLYLICYGAYFLLFIYQIIVNNNFNILL